MLLHGCVAKEDRLGASYGATVQSTFLRSCFAGNGDDARAIAQEAVCGCTLASLERTYTQREFLTIDKAMSAGQKPPVKFSALVRACVASFSVRRRR